MRESLRWPLTGALGLGLLGAPLVHVVATRPASPFLPTINPADLPLDYSPSQAALREAAFWRVQAVQVADDECDREGDTLKAWDPAIPFNQKETRCWLLSCDHGGYLGRARLAARRAAALAMTQRDAQRAAEELTRLRNDVRLPAPERAQGIALRGGKRRG